MSTDLEISSNKSLVEQVADFYIDTCGYPRESVPTLVQTGLIGMKVAELIKRQKKLPYEKKREVIRHGRDQLTENQVRQVDEFVAQHGVPYSSVIYVPTIGPYLSTEARQLLLQMDPRGYKGKFTERLVIHEGGPNPEALISCTIKFWDGSEYTETGYCSINELMKSRGRKPDEISFHNVVTQAETRAFNRAAFRAAIITGGMMESWEESDNTPQTTVTVSMPGDVPRNAQELIKLALAIHGLSAKELKDKIGQDPRGLSAERVSEIWAGLASKDEPPQMAP